MNCLKMKNKIFTLSDFIYFCKKQFIKNEKVNLFICIDINSF
jgi:hypothetical protein